MNILVEGEIKTKKAFAFSIAQELRTLFDLRAERENSFLSSLLFASSYLFYSLHFSLSLFRYLCLSLPNSPSLSLLNSFSLLASLHQLNISPIVYFFYCFSFLQSYFIYTLYTPSISLSLSKFYLSLFMTFPPLTSDLFPC